MQSLEQKVMLERRVDVLVEAKNIDVQGMGKRARDAMKRNDYDEALVIAEKAERRHQPPVRLSELLVARGHASNIAQARRLCDQGTVYIDDVKARRYDQKVSFDQVVSIQVKEEEEELESEEIQLEKKEEEELEPEEIQLEKKEEEELEPEE